MKFDSQLNENVQNDLTTMRHLHQDNIIASSIGGVYYLIKTAILSQVDGTDIIHSVLTALSKIDGAGIFNSVLTAVACYLVIRFIKTFFPEKFKEK